MGKTYASVMTRCMAISALCLVAGVATPFPPYIPFGIAILPLIWYHFSFLRSRASEGLSQPAIDSVYYYGFLITVGALGATAMRLAAYGIGDSLPEVAMQFGLGLMATGYAVWARIDLTSVSKLMDETDLEEIMNRYVERSRGLVDNVDLAASAFGTLEKTVLDQIIKLNERVALQAQETMLEAAFEFKRALSAMGEEAKLSLQEVRAIVNDVTFGAEREALRDSVAAMVTTVTGLSSKLAELQASAGTSAGAVAELAGGLSEVRKQANAAAITLTALGTKDGAIAKLITQADQGAQKLGSLAATASVAETAVKSFQRGVDDQAGAIDEMVKNARAAARGFNAVTTASEQSVEFAANLGKSIDELKSFPAGLHAVSASIQDLDGHITSVSKALNSAEHRLRQSTSQFDRDSHGQEDLHGEASHPTASNDSTDGNHIATGSVFEFPDAK